MKSEFTAVITLAILGLQPLTAKEPTIESFLRRIETLEQKVAYLSHSDESSQEKDLPLQLKKPDTNGSLLLNIVEDGQIEMWDKTMDEAAVAERLVTIAGKNPDQPLLIRANPELKFHHIVRVIDLCQKSRIENISFATIPAEPKR